MQLSEFDCAECPDAGSGFGAQRNFVYEILCTYLQKYIRTKMVKLAPWVGFEPTTKWLTATYSTAELPRNSLDLTEDEYIKHGGA